MDTQDLAYALTQVVHNFGAVAVTAGAVGGRWPRAPLRPGGQRRLGWLVLAGWGVQGSSGATFGAISYAAFGRLPEIHGIALAALLLKASCALGGLAVSALLLAREPAWSAQQRQRAWTALLVFAAAALFAAAFLRWFS